jgi:hypothetical protein
MPVGHTWQQVAFDVAVLGDKDRVGHLQFSREGR